MTSPDPEHQRATRATEDWFLRHGLPFFVEGRKISVDDLAHGRSVLVLGLVYFGSLVIAVPPDRAWPTSFAICSSSGSTPSKVTVSRSRARKSTATCSP